MTGKENIDFMYNPVTSRADPFFTCSMKDVRLGEYAVTGEEDPILKSPVTGICADACSGTTAILMEIMRLARLIRGWKIFGDMQLA
jgi:hypothetical protein